MKLIYCSEKYSYSMWHNCLDFMALEYIELVCTRILMHSLISLHCVGKCNSKIHLILKSAFKKFTPNVHGWGFAQKWCQGVRKFREIVIIYGFTLQIRWKEGVEISSKSSINLRFPCLSSFLHPKKLLRQGYTATNIKFNWSKIRYSNKIYFNKIIFLSICIQRIKIWDPS